MPETVADLLKSKAVVWIAPTGTARPDETTVAYGATWPTGWVKLGYTKEPLTVLYEFEEHEMMVEQVLGPVKRRKTNEHVTFETVLSEATALNMAYVTGGTTADVTSTAAGAAQKAFEVLTVGNDPVLQQWALGFEGAHYDSTGTAQPLRIYAEPATININGELTFSQKDDDYTGIPLQVKALADTATSGRMFVWERVTAPATA
jgi:hypothetical protein